MEDMNPACLEYLVSLLCSNSLMYEALYQTAGIKEIITTVGRLEMFTDYILHSKILSEMLKYVFVRCKNKTCIRSKVLLMCHFLHGLNSHYPAYWVRG